MGAMVAAVSRKNRNVTPEVFVMLRALTHRGTDAHGVATPNLAIITKSIDKLTVENIKSNVALGHNFSRILPEDRPQPILGDDFSFVFEGRSFFPYNTDADKITSMLRPNPQRSAQRLINELEGSYAFAVATSNRVIVGRDAVGTYPLYYGKNSDICAIASERKALWAIGMRRVKSFPPGNLAIINEHGFLFTPIKTIPRPPTRSIGMKIAVKRLHELLLESVEKRVKDLNEVAIAFSGGLDSSIIAALAKACGVNVRLISVGLEGRPELRWAEEAAEALGMPLHLQTYTVNDVERILPRVLWLVEEPNIMKVGVAIPMYWVAENAWKLGCRILLAGQGGDELFGGYRRYVESYLRFGVVAVEDMMYRDVLMSYETNFQRDYQVCAFHGVELRLPYTDYGVTCFALSLPIDLKIESIKDTLRKRVLREMARAIGIPLPIAERAKKAVQYATGVNKALRELARKRGIGLKGYIETVFQGVYPNVNSTNS